MRACCGWTPRSLRPRVEARDEPMEPPRLHIPAMVLETLRLLGVAERGGLYVDCTLGTGSHAQAILDAHPDARVIGIDLDADSQAFACARLANYGDRLIPVRGNYRDVNRLCIENLEVDQVDGLIIDAGVSLWQLTHPERGFSFRRDAEFNVAYDRSQHRTGYDLVNLLPEHELASLIRKYSNERWADRIAHRIVEARRRQPIRRTAQLAEIVTAAIPARFRHATIDPATRTFAALRQSTNDDWGSLEAAIPNAATIMAPNATLVVLTYTSAEDRLVKSQFKRLSAPRQRKQRYPQSQQGSPSPPTSPFRDLPNAPPSAAQSPSDAVLFRILTPKPLLPQSDEIRSNPRCRGCRLRAAARV